MKTYNQFNFMAILAIFGLTLALTACADESGNGETVTLAAESYEAESYEAENHEAQSLFSRTIEITNPRMNGDDVLHLQTRLLALGFSGVGSADGWYGPLTAGAIQSIQTFSGFEADRRVTNALWDYIFDDANTAFLRNIGIVSLHNPALLERTRNFFDHIQPIIRSPYDPDYGETPSGWVYFSPVGRSPQIAEVDLGFYVFTFYFIDDAHYFVKNKINQSDTERETIGIYWIDNNHRFWVENGSMRDRSDSINRLIESAFSYKAQILNKFFDEYVLAGADALTDWIDIDFLRIPPDWSYVINDTGDPNFSIHVEGEGASGPIRMFIWYVTLGNPYMLVDEYSVRQAFSFNNGRSGYLLREHRVDTDDRTGVLWLQAGPWIALSLSYDSSDSVFAANEELLLQIARTLRCPSYDRRN